jgi:hypothetical protein
MYKVHIIQHIPHSFIWYFFVFDCLRCSYSFICPWFFTCNARYPLLEMLLSNYNTKNSQRGMNTFPSSPRSIWREQWIKPKRTTIPHFASTFLFLILPSVQISWRKSKFITIWTPNQRCPRKSSRCLCTHVQLWNKSLFNSSSGMSQTFYKRQRNSQCLVSLTFNLPNGSTT